VIRDRERHTGDRVCLPERSKPGIPPVIALHIRSGFTFAGALATTESSERRRGTAASRADCEVLTSAVFELRVNMAG
jgi:hypothetical protein